jgi:hypothetical protein
MVVSVTVNGRKYTYFIPKYSSKYAGSKTLFLRRPKMNVTMVQFTIDEITPTLNMSCHLLDRWEIQVLVVLILSISTVMSTQSPLSSLICTSYTTTTLLLGTMRCTHATLVFITCTSYAIFAVGA